MSTSEEAKMAAATGEAQAAAAGQKVRAETRNKRVYFDVETKMHTLNRIDNGETKAAIIKEMRLPPSTLATWIKDRHRISELYRHSLGHRKKRLRHGHKPQAPPPPPLTIDVDPAHHHLGGPFVTPCAAVATRAASTPGGSPAASLSPSTPDAAAATAETAAAAALTSGSSDDQPGPRDDGDCDEADSKPLPLPPVPPSLPLPPSTTFTTNAFAIPLLRRPPPMLSPGQQLQQHQQQQPSLTLRPPQQAAVSWGAFLTPQTVGSSTHQQQQLLQDPHQQQQATAAAAPVTKAALEELFQRYVAQVSAMLTFTISPLHASLEQLAQLLKQPDSRRRAPDDGAWSRWNWLEHARPHPCEADKVVLAEDTSYELTVPARWLRDCCDVSPERTLANLLARALPADRLQTLLRDGGLPADATFKALRHYVAFTQGPVSTAGLCTALGDPARPEDATD